MLGYLYGKSFGSKIQTATNCTWNWEHRVLISQYYDFMLANFMNFRLLIL